MAARELHPVGSAAVGACSGVVEVLLQQPSISIKNSIQNMKPIRLDPRVLYRGVGINSTSIAPVIALQFGVHSVLERRLSDSPTVVQRGAIAGVAGMVSALFSGPAELLMIQQQRSGLNLMQQAHSVSHNHGWIGVFRGLSPTAVREGVFTSCYLGLQPVAQQKIMNWPGARLQDRPGFTSFVAASVSGLVAAVITHPFDTIKTRMQANLGVPGYRTVTSTSQILWSEGKTQAFYSGILPRTQRVVCAVYIYGEVKTRLTDWYVRSFGANNDIAQL